MKGLLVINLHKKAASFYSQVAAASRTCFAPFINRKKTHKNSDKSTTKEAREKNMRIFGILRIFGGKICY
jgi:hypothetical protein